MSGRRSISTDAWPVTALPSAFPTSSTDAPSNVVFTVPHPGEPKLEDSMNTMNDDSQADPIATRPRSTVARVGRPAALVAAGLIAGGVLTGALSAGAATVTGTTNS